MDRVDGGGEGGRDDGMIFPTYFPSFHFLFLSFFDFSPLSFYFLFFNFRRMR